MAKRYIVGIQNRFDNEAKFDCVLVKDTEFTPEEILWAVACYGRAYKYGRMPESWQSTELNESFDLLSLVYAPDQLVKYVDWPHRLDADNKSPRNAIALVEFHQREMHEARKRVDAYVREWAVKSLNETMNPDMQRVLDEGKGPMDMLKAMLWR